MGRGPLASPLTISLPNSLPRCLQVPCGCPPLHTLFPFSLKCPFFFSASLVLSIRILLERHLGLS